MILFSIPGSGKSTTMFGIENEFGILGLSVERFLRSNAINISAIEFINKTTFDLVEGKKTELEKRCNPKIKTIRTVEELRVVVKSVLKLRVQKSTNQNFTSSRSHLILVISIEGKSGRMIFADLAGFESGKGKEDIQETQFINSSLNELNQLLLKVSRNMVVSNGSYPLTNFLNPYLKKSARTLMLYHVLNGSVKKQLENIKDIVPSKTAEKRKPGNSSLPLRQPLKPLNMNH